MISTDLEAATAQWLLSAEAVRTQCRQIFAVGERDELQHFRYHPDRLAAVADYVADTIRDNYPTLDIPYHARWRHFVVAGEDRWADHPLSLCEDPLERARRRIDLAVVSVLLDAGAGESWRYADTTGTGELRRSEGLAIASLDAFCAGLFSDRANDPARADAAALIGLDEVALETAFQVTRDNPLAGLSGRASLMNRLGRTVNDGRQYFGTTPRIGNLADYFLSISPDATLSAASILKTVLEALAEIWPGRVQMAGRNLGDTWLHPAASLDGPADGLVPFHKLSQWLSYSLVEPLQELGLTITEPDALTGLAEYRNGGLLLDGGLLSPKHDGIIGKLHEPDSEVIVEWRALTVALLDKLAAEVRHIFGRSAVDMPLAAVLEGGTWAAGRRIARERRDDGGPPLNIVSDGSVF